MFNPDWLILCILHQSFEIERLKGHWSEVVELLHLYNPVQILKMTALQVNANVLNVLKWV